MIARANLLIRRPVVLVLIALVGATLFVRHAVFGASPEPSDPWRYSGTAAMAERLHELALHFDGNRVSSTRVPAYSLLARYLAPPMGFSDDARGRILGQALEAERHLQRGDAVDAVDGFRAVRTAAQAQRGLFDRDFFHALGRELAISYLRLGEQQNCVAQHNGESCILPIRGGGVHTRQDGARAAIAEYQALLAEFPDDLAMRWLLNIAYMTIGEYPESVPARWRIDPSVFASEDEMPRFAQVAATVGLDLRGRAGSVIVDDFDGDGYLDVVVSRMSLDESGQLRLFHNNGDGSFVERTREAGLEGITGGLHIVQTDYDNDGRLDILVPRGAWAAQEGRHPLSLLHNDGGGHFSDVTVAAGLLALHPTQAVAWADFDNDGWLDLYVGRESFTFEGLWNYMRAAVHGDIDHPSGIPSFERHPSALYRNNHDGTFTDVAAAAGADLTGFIKGVTVADYDNDGKMDIFVSRLLEPNVLLHNDGHLRFSDRTRQAGVTKPPFSFPTWFFDYDNDGWPDLFVGDSPAHLGLYDNGALVAASYLGLAVPESGKSRLYHNNHDGTFSDVSEEMGVARPFLPMGCSFGDIDNDGWLDFYLGTGNPSYEVLVPNRMFRNVGGKRFADVTTSGGFGHLQKGHGVAFADLDEDGDQDVYGVFGGAFTGDQAHNALFENPGNANHWLKLTLEGVRSNRAAIGARVRVTVDTGSGTRDIYSTVTTGASFGGTPLRREIGLGDARAVRAVEIRWPGDAHVQRLGALEMDHAYRVREGQPWATVVTLAPFVLGGQAQRAAR